MTDYLDGIGVNDNTFVQRDDVMMSVADRVLSMNSSAPKLYRQLPYTLFFFRSHQDW